MLHNKKLDPGPPPCNLHVFKGLKNGAFSAEFVKFVTSNPLAVDYYNWLFNTKHACEHLASTLATVTMEKKSHGSLWKVVQRFDAGVLVQRDEMYSDSSW